MATSTSPRPAAFFATHASNVVPLRSGRSSTPIMRVVRTRAEPRRRSAIFETKSYWGWTEVAILSALSWLGSFVVEGLIHCAFVHHAGDPRVIQQILDEQKRAAKAEIRRTAQEIRP